MAEALTFLAEEVGRAVALVWGGVGIAAKLNYEVMSVVVTITTRMVQLLLLLTQKFAQLFSILTHDTMLFLGDIGNGVMAAISTVHSFGNTICCGVGAIGTGIVSSCYRVYSLISLIHTSLVDLLAYFVSQIVNLFYVLKCGFILFGSAVLFGISFLPNLVCLLITGSVQLIGNFYLRVGLLVQDCCFAFEYMVTSLYLSVRDFLGDIPIHAVLGACLGALILVGLRLLLQYMIDNVVLVPDLPIPSFVTNARRHLLNWYVRVWQEANRPPTRENSTDEEFLDDASDHNGNDNNDNVPDLNLIPEEPLPRSIPLPSVASNSSERSSVHLASVSTYTPASVSTYTPASAPDIDLLQEEESVHSVYELRSLGRPPIAQKRILGFKEDVTEDLVKKAVKSSQGKEVHRSSRGICKTNDMAWAKHLYKELQDEREEKLCIICQDKPKSVILLPCRHMCLCDSCRSAIITRDNTCPICRKTILDTLTVYLS